MNLSSKSRKLHCMLIIHVKGYLQTRTIEQSRFSFVRGNAITLLPAIRRRTYCCRSVVSVGSRKSTQERAGSHPAPTFQYWRERLMGKPTARTQGPTTVGIDRGDHDQRR